MNRNLVPGTVFGARNWHQSRTTVYVFVPDSYFNFNEEEGRDPAAIDFSTFDEETYRISRWPILNALANNLDENLLLLPGLENLLPLEEENSPQFRLFQQALEVRFKENLATDNLK